EFGGQILERLSFGPLGLAPRMPVQPVAVAEVAEHLARLAVEPPRRATLDLAGPGREDLAVMARRTARRDGGPRVVVPVRVPGAFGKGVRAGALVPDAPALVGRQSFEAWLAAR
ncbi:MAG TPA: 3-beta hydroxysteroid dehydrogenase, partial [Nocardioides sp.]